jgi:hypothetical protein
MSVLPFQRSSGEDLGEGPGKGFQLGDMTTTNLESKDWSLLLASSPSPFSNSVPYEVNPGRPRRQRRGRMER